MVPEIEASLHAARGETARLAGALEEQQATSKRRERQLSNELRLATQVPGRFKIIKVIMYLFFLVDHYE